MQVTVRVMVRIRFVVVCAVDMPRGRRSLIPHLHPQHYSHPHWNPNCDPQLDQPSLQPSPPALRHLDRNLGLVRLANLSVGTAPACTGHEMITAMAMNEVCMNDIVALASQPSSGPGPGSGVRVRIRVEMQVRIRVRMRA